MEKPRFKWQNFIEVSDEWGEQERADIIATLDQIEPLHLMQETLRDIPLNKLYDWQSDKIKITPDDHIAAYDSMTRIIGLPSTLTGDFKYLDKYKIEREQSLTRVILHELQHAINPGDAAEYKNAVERFSKSADFSIKEAFGYVAALVNRDDKIIAKLSAQKRRMLKMHTNFPTLLLGEHVVLSRVNPTMKAFFNEEPRAHYYNENTVWGERKKTRLRPATTNKAYHENSTRNVNEPITDAAKDMRMLLDREYYEYGGFFSKLVKEKRQEDQRNFPNGNSRPF